MSFLSPLFLVGALAVGIPIMIHLLKREPDVRLKFSAVHLLKSGPVENASRRHLRELLLLALRVAALVLLAVAFARPFLTSGASASTGVTVVALDTSLSMSAPGQFEKARQLATQAIDRASGGLVAVVTFGDGARVASEPSGDRAMAASAVAAAQPGVGGTSYRAALNAATDALRGRAGTIVVVTDLQESGWDAGDRASIPDSVQMEILDVGAPPPNLAVTAARIAGDRVEATIHNSAPEARNVRVSLAVHAGALDSQPASKADETTILVERDQSADVTFPRPRGAWALVSVDDQQGAVGDNTRYLVLDSAARPGVLVVTATGDLPREGFYVQQALIASGADGSVYRVDGVSGAALQSWDQPRVDAHAAVVLLSTRGLEHHGRALLAEYTRQGGGVLLAAGADIDGEVVAEAFGGATMTIVPPQPGGGGAGSVRTLAPADVRHPVLQTFAGRSSLGLVKFHRVATIRAAACPTLARFTTGEPALVDCELGQGRALILASDLDNRWSDFPLHATFVPFMHEAMRYLSMAGRSSEYLVARAPAGVPPVPGVAPFARSAGATPQLVAVNVDPAESSSGRLTPEEFQTAVTRLAGGGATPVTLEAREREERQHIWQYVLAAMIAMLVMESVVAMRTA